LFLFRLPFFDHRRLWFRRETFNGLRDSARAQASNDGSNSNNAKKPMTMSQAKPSRPAAAIQSLD